MFIALEAETITAGIDALYESLRTRASVVMPLKNQFYGMREFGILDPDDYVIFFAQQLSEGQ